MNLFDISGRKAIVTGGSRGLGKGMAEGLLESGVEVVIIGSSNKTNQAVQEWTSKGYKAHAVIADLSERPDIEDAFNKAYKLLGNQLDILVTAAGIQRRHPSEEFPIEDWNSVLAVNLTSVFIICQLAAGVMIPCSKGKIITIASLNSFFGGQTIPAYAASKGGIAQLTKAFSNDWASKGLNINALAPGYMDTDMNEKLINSEVRKTQIFARIPMERWGTPADMKGPVVFLASDASNYLNGAIIPVDGGYLGK